MTKQDELNDQTVNMARLETIKTVENDKTYIIASADSYSAYCEQTSTIMHVESEVLSWTPWGKSPLGTISLGIHEYTVHYTEV
jgi:hypothetical protein